MKPIIVGSTMTVGLDICVASLLDCTMTLSEQLYLMFDINFITVGGCLNLDCLF